MGWARDVQKLDLLFLIVGSFERVSLRRGQDLRAEFP